MLDSIEKQQFAGEIRQRLEAGVNLPVLPEVARECLRLRNTTNSNVNQLVETVSKDPVISSHLLRYARMASFGYGDRIKTLSEAINQVLGYDKALHMAIGLSAGRSLPVDNYGPLGLKAFWARSLRCASLTRALSNELPLEKRPAIGLSYLAGLVHDIGYLLLGVFYPDKFSIINRSFAVYKDFDVRELEFHCIGITHDLIGGYLMQSWQMPEEIIVSTREHHFQDYDGNHCIYPNLVFLAIRLMQMSDHPGSFDLPWKLMEKLCLDENAVLRVQSDLDEQSEEFDLIIKAVVA